MEQLVEKGLVRAIGISNFTITKTENLLKTAKIVPAVNQGKENSGEVYVHVNEDITICSRVSSLLSAI